VSDAAEVTATWLRGFEARVQTRGHVIAVDEPLEDGGTDAGVMPTDLLAASIASCFCLALAFTAAASCRAFRLPSGGSAPGASFASNGSRSKLEPRSPRTSSRR
jgi:hypothetical protein